VEYTIDNGFNLRDLVLQVLVLIIMVFLYKKIKIKIQMWYSYRITIKKHQKR